MSKFPWFANSERQIPTKREVSETLRLIDRPTVGQSPAPLDPTAAQRIASEQRQRAEREAEQIAEWRRTDGFERWLLAASDTDRAIVRALVARQSVAKITRMFGVGRPYVLRLSRTIPDHVDARWVAARIDTRVTP